MKKCKITVMRITRYEDLMARVMKTPSLMPAI